MHPPAPPKIMAVEVIATQPTEADSAAISQLSADAGKPLEPVAYLVKVRLKTKPPATSHGWALYVGEERIPKYWEYKDGIYFKVFSAQFFAQHKGNTLRFSPNDAEFIDTGVKLTAPASVAAKPKGRGARLPLQSEALK